MRRGGEGYPPLPLRERPLVLPPKDQRVRGKKENMQLHQLRPPKGAKTDRKRVGRGDGSGHGSYSGKGMKGQKSRTGGGVRPGFEGGQLPLIKSLPTVRGFYNRFRVAYAPVNLDRLARFPANSDVNPDSLASAGVIDAGSQVKVLARGDLSVPLTVSAHKFSKAARRKIEAAGGTVKEIA
jgi:large subunit ribosomal protein L15